MTEEAGISGNQKKESPHDRLKFEAPTLEAAIAAAAEKFQTHKRNIRHRILQEPSSGFLGMGAKPARIEAWKHDPADALVNSVLSSVADLDGHFLIELVKHDLMLTVYPPMGSGRPANPAEIVFAARAYEPDKLDERAIREAAAAKELTTRPIGQIINIRARDGSYSVKISFDRMKAEVTITPPKRGGKYVSYEDVLAGLNNAGVVYGIDESGLKKAVAEGIIGEPICAAKGKFPAKASPGRVEYFFRTNLHQVNFAEDEKGRVDYKELNMIENVSAGDILARVHPPIPGLPGYDVTGRSIAADSAEPAKMPQGENLLYQGDEVRAGIDGHVVLLNGCISVSPVLHVRGDVNYESGNIDFSGTVRIDGLIEDNFSVRGTGSLFVQKSIGKCDVKVSGSLVVIGGILGKQEAEIEAGGDVVALFIEHAKVRAKGNMTVGAIILHSEIIVGGDLVLNGERAALIGGSTIVGGNIQLRTIGGEGTSRTRIRAGIPPETVLAIEARREEIESEEERLRKVREAVAAIEKTANADGLHSGQLEKLTSARDQIASRMHFLRAGLRDLEERAFATVANVSIHVLEKVVPGTRIEIGDAVLNVNVPITYASFRRVGNQIKYGPYCGA